MAKLSEGLSTRTTNKPNTNPFFRRRIAAQYLPLQHGCQRRRRHHQNQRLRPRRRILHENRRFLRLDPRQRWDLLPQSRRRRRRLLHHLLHQLHPLNPLHEQEALRLRPEHRLHPPLHRLHHPRPLSLVHRRDPNRLHLPHERTRQFLRPVHPRRHERQPLTPLSSPLRSPLHPRPLQ